MSVQTNSLAVMEAREKPDLGRILRQLRDAVNAAAGMGLFDKLELCHQTKRCWWQGQEVDGRMGEPAMGNQNLYWWEGAPETRRHKADEIVIERAGVRELVRHRGQLMVKTGLRARVSRDTTDDDDAKGWQVALETYAKAIERELDYEWALHCTCVEELGYSIQTVGWRERLRNDKRVITVAQLTEVIVARVEQSVRRAALENGLLPGATEEEAMQAPLPPELLREIEVAGAEALELVLSDPQLTGTGLMDLQAIDPAIRPSEAKRVIRALRKGEPGEYMAPADDGGLPDVWTCVPWVHCIHPVSLTGKGQADLFAVPEWVTETTLKERAAAEGWDQGFVTEVLKHPNQMMSELMTYVRNSWVLNGAGIGLMLDLQGMADQTPVYQIITVWHRSVNRAGLPMIFRTVVHALVSEKYGLHECTRLRVLPFQVETSEPVTLAVLSRGVGEKVVAAQNQVMDLLNGEGARAMLGSNPPLLRSGRDSVAVRPGMQIYGGLMAGSGRVNEFMATPPVDGGSLKLIELHETFVDQLYFRGAAVDADTKQQQREILAHRARKTLAGLMQLMGEVLRARLTPEQLAEAAGRPVNVNALDTATVQVGVNVTGLSGESSEEWLNFLKSLAALDRGGRVDWGEVVTDAIMARNPAMAERLVIPGDVAASRITDEQETRTAKIMAGVPVEYPERSSNPQLRLEVMQRWAALPNNVARAQQDPQVAEMMQKEFEYLQLQIQQYQENALIGRTLVKPNA